MELNSFTMTVRDVIEKFNDLDFKTDKVAVMSFNMSHDSVQSTSITSRTLQSTTTDY